MRLARTLTCLAIAAMQITPVMAAPAPAALPGPPQPPYTLWNFLGIPQGVNKVRDATTNRRGNFPGMERKPPLKAIADPKNLDSGNPAIKKAAEVKGEEDLAPQKIKALKYLARVGCGCYDQDGGVTDAFLAALDDCTEEVRFQAAIAIHDAASNHCEKCNGNCCCNQKIVEKLAKIAYEKNDACCWLEPSERVREAARDAMCVCCGAGGIPMPTTAVPADVTPPVPPKEREREGGEPLPAPPVERESRNGRPNAPAGEEWYMVSDGANDGQHSFQRVTASDTPPHSTLRALPSNSAATGEKTDAKSRVSPALNRKQSAKPTGPQAASDRRQEPSQTPNAKQAAHKSKDVIQTAAYSDQPATASKNVSSKNVSSRRQATERGLAFDNTVETVEADNSQQTATNEIAIRKMETTGTVAAPKAQKKSTVTIYEPEPSEVPDEDVVQTEPESELANDGPLTPPAPTMNPWPKQTPVTANGAISDVDPDTGTADVRFMGRHRLRVGMKLHVSHRYLLTNARVGDVEVVAIGPKSVIVRPLDGVKLAKLSPGDEVTVDSRPMREPQPGSSPQSADAERLSRRPQNSR